MILLFPCLDEVLIWCAAALRITFTYKPTAAMKADVQVPVQIAGPLEPKKAAAWMPRQNQISHW